MGEEEAMTLMITGRKEEEEEEKKKRGKKLHPKSQERDSPTVKQKSKLNSSSVVCELTELKYSRWNYIQKCNWDLTLGTAAASRYFGERRFKKETGLQSRVNFVHRALTSYFPSILCPAFSNQAAPF